MAPSITIFTRFCPYCLHPQYFNLQRSLGLTVGILFGYLGVMHILTYLALVAVARREAR